MSVATNELTLGAELLVEVLMTFSANAAASAARDGHVTLDLANLLIAARLGPRVVHAATRAGWRQCYENKIFTISDCID